ncbi:putative phospholipase D1 [Triangularia verruculosa]|uniref:Phospholipase D1 n=1 Tax=Triangularia verruculosa TaxID=2587418 RepID=A0AAN6XAP9_9PEZI|nr:putative phospholipase D1 [Triangularia verruculosa]
MTDTPRLEPAGTPRKETKTTLSSGTLGELPTIPQAQLLHTHSSPLLSDHVDFATRPATRPNSLRGQNNTENQPTDYLNGAVHDRESPPAAVYVNAAAVYANGSIPSAPNLEGPPRGAASSPPSVLDPTDFASPNPNRKSVQFTRDDFAPDPIIAHSRQGSWDTREAFGKFRGSGFISKLKDLKGPGGSHTPKTPGAGPSELPSTASSPTALRNPPRIPRAADEGSDIDADAEETADETAGASGKGKQRKKRRIRRPRMDSYSTPNTPQVGLGSQDSHPGHGRFGGLLRRATLGGAEEHGVLSEGEGRDRLTNARAPRRVTPWSSRGGHDDGDDAESPGGSRVGHHFRRFSALGGGGGGVSDGDAISPRRPFFGTERASTFSAQKWRQVKGALKLLRKKPDEQFDFAKSAELMAELRAVTPAVLMLASMIQRDEHGNKRIPVLLEQLRLKVKGSTPSQEKDSERHWLFEIELEYGSGPSQMKWTIQRTIKDILNLHWKYKLTLGNEKLPSIHQGARPKQPSFPLSAFPYLRGVRGLDESDDEDVPNSQLTPNPLLNNNDRAEETAGELTAGEATVQEGTDVDAPIRKRRSRMSYLGARRKTSALGSMADLGASALDPNVAKRRYVERQQRTLEKYLQDMIRWLMFRADSNRLCRFLELSALGVRLAAEGSYHGKECYLHIQSSKGLDFRRVLTPGKVIARHSRKWFLVRQSYIVCVESPENMNIYDVYLVDPKFKLISKNNKDKELAGKEKEGEDDIENLDLAAPRPAAKHHTLKILTSERKVKLFSPNQHLIQQFEESIVEMLKNTPWHLRNRFGSFAPVRTGVYAQWLVDGRDYMWNVSRAISMAKDVIYIHDWWLSPELYMRRPACISQKWRLDRLLQRKAAEGVKIFVIVYRNVEAAIPIDSEYTKFSLLNLHPNVFVQRSPHQFKKNQFFFAHHEKVVIVDHDIAFVGGIDLCFGRWDCPQHPVVDDKPTGFEPQEGQPRDAEHVQLFPGKDYSNPRVRDFFRLNEPYEEMYDRSRIPRMPWHDISMQVVGQPARDLTRHFVQRWNYVRRGRKPTRPTPFLLPPPDCNLEELEAVGLNGTCEVQILRSASTWSLGIEDTEQSIHLAYIKMIEDSDHFVYMENQFFVTSTETLNTKMVNGIGDALVRRIIRAHENDEDWRAVILIPLMPGFQNEVNEQDGTSVRLILQCQYRSICRGEHSIFGRLRAAGIDPEDYIQFFSLRQWGKMSNGMLTTEILYIHAKCIIVDDRVALIGSANINERSMLGNRDSEAAAIVRDTDMIWSTMAGRPYQVGRFAHTLRLRLMREHLGLDVDEILEEERQADLDQAEAFEAEMDRIYSDESDGLSPVAESSRRRSSARPEPLNIPSRKTPSDQQDTDPEKPVGRGRSTSRASKGKASADLRIEIPQGDKNKPDVEGSGQDRWKAAQEEGLDQGRDSVVVNDREVLVHDVLSGGRGTLDSPKQAHQLRRPSVAPSRDEGGVDNDDIPPMPPFDRRTTEQLGLPRANQLPTLPMVDDTDIGGPPVHTDANGRLSFGPMHTLPIDIKPADIHKDCMRDPLNPAFYDEVWSRAAENNTRIYRRVFRCMPDSEATNWAEYKEFDAYNQRFKESMDLHRSDEESEKPHMSHAAAQAAGGGAGIGAPGPATVSQAMAEKISSPIINTIKDAANKDEQRKDGVYDEKQQEWEGVNPDPAVVPDNSSQDHLPQQQSERLDVVGKPRERRATFSNNNNGGEKPPKTGDSTATGSQRKPRRRATTRGSNRKGGFLPGDDMLGRGEAEELLGMTQGALVQFPYDWLVVEETNGNWLFQVDQVAPLAI